YYLVTLEVPDSLRQYQTDELPGGWQATGGSQPLPSQTFLLEWLQKPDSLVVEVPSVVLPIMKNYLINPRHALFVDCEVVGTELLEIDGRLYGAERCE
ncbi:RES family NAD+ phosphorylase, partial [Persicitalea sp.]|uniref:RES family NAD+ phosphorylase n=1 Tax=Persicitalea sp. TaxID=3100273 RepID=UPI00359488AD